MTRSRHSRRNRQAGYNLVALMVIVAVINIAIAASLPVWSNVIQRDKEAELVFRGLQYAEAIRVFQKRTGRFPTRLEELIEIEPRCIRQLWLDPMNDEPEWGLVLAQGQGTVPSGQGRSLTGGDENRLPRRSLREERRERRQRQQERRSLGRGSPAEQETISPRQRIESPDGGRRGVPRAGEQVTRGPIVGVHSLSDETAIRTFDGSTSYSDWKFTTELLPAWGVESAGGENVPRLHSNWIGRALPEGAESLDSGGLPDSPLDRREGRRSKDRRERENDRRRR